MTIFSMRKAAVATGIAALALGLFGCGGHGGSGGGSSNPFAKVSFQGEVESPDGAMRAKTVPTVLNLRTVNANGSAVFTVGKPGDAAFRTYSAEVHNIVFTPDKKSTTTGVMDADFSAFTAGSAFSGTSKYHAKFTVKSKNGAVVVSITSGSLTGTNATGGAVTLTSGSSLADDVSRPYDLPGQYAGTMQLLGAGKSFTGTLSAGSDALHLKADLAGPSGPIVFNGVYAQGAFGGQSDGAGIGYPGATVLWYLSKSDATLLSGGYVVLGQAGSVVATSSLSAAPDVPFKAQYYAGVMTPKGAKAGVNFDLHVKELASESGKHGVAMIYDGAKIPVAARVTTASTRGFALGGFTRGYKSIAFTTVPSLNSKLLYQGDYTAVKADNSTETGSYTLASLSQVALPNFVGSYGGTYKGKSKKATAFALDVAQDGEELTFSSTTTVSGFSIPPVSGYALGNRFVAAGNFSVTSPVQATVSAAFAGNVIADKLGNPTGQLTGDFDVSAASGGLSLGDIGTFDVKKGAPAGGGGGGGGSTSLKTGYYDGGVKGSNGQLDGRIVKLSVLNASSTVGSNGAMILTSSGLAPGIGGRLASVMGSGSTVTITVDRFTSTYSKWVLTGTISGSTLNLTYTATLLNGTTQTGSFDQLGKVNVTTPTLNATYTGALTGTNGANNAFTGLVKSSADGTVTVTTTSKVAAGIITLPTMTGYIAGTTIALKDASETDLPSPYAGGNFYGNFDGNVDGNSISGKYVAFVVKNNQYAFTEYGSLSLSK